MSFWIRNRKKGALTSVSVPGCLFIFVFVGSLLAAIVLPWLARRARPEGLLGAMYRSEASLVAIESAIRAYRTEYDVLPSSGKEGLQLAIDEQNRNVTFYPGGIPKDGWDRDYVYVKSDDYDAEGSLAVKDARSGLYHNPGGYQLYSLGADGERSPEDGLMAGDRLNDDNINNWDSNAKWRAVYRRRAKRIPDVKEE